ncbi:M20/M25/M40 family metallo-hydrolase [Amycolatopsis sp. NPDC051903]|uniref:M20/M25/M40 family metallo-hydrolase n=1 Tax=Amycolatopsis sp. NPDC051903 TaxID=3363936 RepID=UPI0037A5C9FE
MSEAVETTWVERILPSLSAFVKIQSISPAYDREWRQRRQLTAAVEHVAAWARTTAPPGSTAEILELRGWSPLLLIEIPPTPGATGGETALLYGHLDKQPAFTEWSEGLGPWQPAWLGERLYGRGAVDDGYAGYAAVAAVNAIRAAGGEHCRVVIILETAEESGSPGLRDYLSHFADRLGTVTLVICLDSGGGDFERLWVTRSLRGMLQATLTVSLLAASVHSGFGSGVVPSSFRVLRLLLDRIEDPATGQILLPAMNALVEADRVADAAALAKLKPGWTLRPTALLEGVQPTSDDEVERILNNTWRPALSITGAAGLPDVAEAGAVLRASTSLRLNFRLPPTVDAAAAADALRRVVTTDVPYSASVAVTDVVAQDGWCASELPAWLSAALTRTDSTVFHAQHQSIGLGAGIPFMRMLADAYPDAAFLVTGAVGAESNMHVADEWLHIPFARRITETVAHALAAHVGHKG